MRASARDSLQSNSLKIRAKDVLPNTNRTQATEITPGSDGMVPSAAG